MIAITAIAGATVFAVGVWALQSQAVPPPKDEARKALANGQAAKAERALAHASRRDPVDPEPWMLRMELLRLEDRQVEAQRLGWEAYSAVQGASRRAILREITLALLADTPDDLARETLARWIEADPSDIDSRVALLQRIAASPRATDPDRIARVDSLRKIVEEHPDHIGAREALVLALADSGDPDQGRSVLAGWPEAGRDARYFRLAGRWDLEYDRLPTRAAESFREALKELPHDWRTRYRLARALRNAGLPEEAKRVATEVERLREVLDPVVLGRRLDHDLATLDEPKSRLDLADLCTRAGLTKLGDAWKLDAEQADAVDPIHGRLGPGQGAP